MLDYQSIINQYYTIGSDLHRVLTLHSKQVADYAMMLIDGLPQKRASLIDREFVYEAAMLHDIGVFKTNAPSIFCVGAEPYMQHGLIGAEILREKGLERHALVCERHIGAGLSAKEILAQQLPLPARDFLPITLEEKLVCYADNFFSKSRIEPVKSVDSVRAKMARFGTETLARFDEMTKLFH